jgi:Transglutaminase-like superfamily
LTPLRKFLNLPGPRKLLLPCSFAVVAVVRASLWILPFKLIVRILDRIAPAPELGVPGERGTIEEITWAVPAVSRYVPQASCLTQALSGKFLIAVYAKRAVELEIGVRFDEQKRFEAHAWLIHEGDIILGGPGAELYTPLLKI